MGTGNEIEERLKVIIEGWQKKFFVEFIQPSIQSQFELMQNQIMTSMEKRVPPSSHLRDISQSYVDEEILVDLPPKPSNPILQDHDEDGLGNYS